jgi:hypothetical protein
VEGTLDINERSAIGICFPAVNLNNYCCVVSNFSDANDVRREHCANAVEPGEPIVIGNPVVSLKPFVGRTRHSSRNPNLVFREEVEDNLTSDRECPI